MTNSLQREQPPVTKSIPTGRNPLSMLIDLLAWGRPRGGGHRMLQVPGRGIVVRRRTDKGPGLGMVLLLGGLGVMLADLSVEGIGRVAVVVGAVLWCDRRQQERDRRLRELNTAANELCQFHKDVGYEEGYNDRDRELRPKLVDLNSRRADAVEPQAFSSAGSVVDRG